MYHWCHLELRKFFGYQGVLNGDTAEEVWNLCNDKLQHDPKLTVRGLIEQSNVAFIGTTDDPIDDLYWHKKIKEDPTIKFRVPAERSSCGSHHAGSCSGSAWQCPDGDTACPDGSGCRSGTSQPLR